MKFMQALVPFTLSLSVWACSDKSAFKSGVPEPDAPQEVVAEVAEEGTIIDDGAVDEGASGTVTLPQIDSADSIGSTAPATDVDSGASADGTSNNDALGALTDKHTVSLKVDVVFAIDTSASMNDEIAATQANLGRMISLLNSGRLDSRIHLMMDQLLTLPVGVDPGKIAFIDEGVGSEDAISRLTALFAGTFDGSYRDAQGAPLATPLPFRKDAKLEVVVISDDNGEGNGNLAADFDPMKTLNATFNAIVGLPTSVENNDCELSNVGMEYITLSTSTKGSALDICSVDWSNLITRLSNDIVKRSVTFGLSQKPSNPKAVIVTLDGKKLAQADWAYDAAQNVVTILKTDLVKDGSQVTLNYNPAPN
ncbi:hypothetical protein [Oligoflexus tunisiensis]|uniref:hypothetical protein n=1 Tax=Oligoflexus tunisiensis TaxID=708132 RepID=UPI00114D16A1|nr:hypothetical protein [Oligoflexus tunisiensis]